MSMYDADGVGTVFLENARDEMVRRYKKMRHVVMKLDENQLNWRPNAQCNSVANLVEHLQGNIGERYRRTLGNCEFMRDRDAEFAPGVWLTSDAALAKLDEAFPAAIRVIEELTVERLIGRAQLPTGRVYVVDFLLQTLTHYAEHVGQAILMSKIQGIELGELPS